jgi:hypothetical protein
MARRPTREQQRQKRVNTRNAMDAAIEYCERHGYSMPLEYFLAIGNGADPRPGADVYFDTENIEGGITVAESTRAMAEAAKYIYVPASKIEVEGHVEARLSPIQINEKVAESLAQKLQKLGIGAAPAGE